MCNNKWDISLCETITFEQVDWESDHRLLIATVTFINTILCILVPFLNGSLSIFLHFTDIIHLYLLQLFNQQCLKLSFFWVILEILPILEHLVQASLRYIPSCNFHGLSCYLNYSESLLYHFLWLLCSPYMHIASEDAEWYPASNPSHFSWSKPNNSANICNNEL